MTGRATLVLLAVVIAALLVPTLSPFRVSYVTTDSMEPTIQEDDGYLVWKTDEVSVGDVVTFGIPEDSAFTTQRDYVTHRVVSRSPDGFVTKGDNNPTTDQASGLSPVTRDDVLGVAVGPGDGVITIPGLGTVVDTAGAARTPLMGLLVVLIALGLLADASAAGRPGRELLYVRDIGRPLFVGVVLTAVLLLYVGITTEELSYVVVDDAAPEAFTLPLGENKTQTITTDIVTTPITTAVVEADGFTIADTQVEGSTINMTADIPAQATLGPYDASVGVHPYPAVLPKPAIRWLHDVAIPLAWAVSLALVFAPVWLAYVVFLDGRAPLRMPRSRWLRRRLGGE